jgi:hypothetical protein
MLKTVMQRRKAEQERSMGVGNGALLSEKPKRR